MRVGIKDFIQIVTQLAHNVAKDALICLTWKILATQHKTNKDNNRKRR